MAISNVVGTPLFPSSVGVGGIVDASEAAQYGLNRTSVNYPAYATYPITNDANIASVSLLCHLDSVASGVGIKSDVGPMAQAFVGAANNAPGALTTAIAKWGSCSFYCNGTNSGGIRFVQAGTEFTFGTGDWTIEFWTYPTATNSNKVILDPRTTATQIVPLIYYDTFPRKLRYFVNGADRITGGTQVSLNAWHHIAVSKVSGSTYMYLDGAQEGATYTDGNNYVGPTNWYFGCQVIGGSFGQGAEGYFQDIRITKGVGRYSGATCTVPVAPFPDY